MIFFCDCCHYTFFAASLPDRCPDCGKQQFSERPAVREATAKEIDDYKRIRIEIAAENKITKLLDINSSPSYNKKELFPEWK